MKTSAELRYSPYDYEIHEDPYPTYARLREEAPVYRNDELDFWALSRHADVRERLPRLGGVLERDGRVARADRDRPARRAVDVVPRDGPAAARTVPRGSFRAGSRPDGSPTCNRTSVELTRQHLEPALDQGTFDFVADFAGKLPMDVISEMIGVPASDRAEVRRLADLLVHREEGVFDVPPPGIDAALELASYFAEHARRTASQPDRRPHCPLCSTPRLDGDRLTDDDIISFLFLMVVAGNETTAKLLAQRLVLGVAQPRRSGRSRSPIRRGSRTGSRRPSDTTARSQMLARTLTDDVELHGVRIPTDGRVLLLVGSANRDPRVFPDPTATTSTATPPRW